MIRFSMVFRFLCVVILTSITLVGAALAQPSRSQSPLVDIGRVPIHLGYPQLNLGYPTQTVVDPEVGKVVRLAQGFGRTPDFTYSFTHPLAQYQYPLFDRGPYGTYNAPFQPDSLPNDKPIDHLKLTPPLPQPPVGVAAPHDPVATVNFLPAPWLLAAQKAKYVPQLAIYAHHSTEPEIKGAYVTGIGVDGMAHQAGLLPGDVITSINGKALTSEKTYENAVKEIKAPWELQVWNAHTNRSNIIHWSGQTNGSQTTP